MSLTDRLEALRLFVVIARESFGLYREWLDHKKEKCEEKT